MKKNQRSEVSPHCGMASGFRLPFVLALLALAVVPVDAAPPGVLRTNVTLQCDYPAGELGTNLVFKIYSSTNLSVAVTNWPLLKTVVATSTHITLPIDATQRFYVMTASNWWGETSFSNVAQTPPIPRDVINVRLGP
ncbi:MAG: hypothetical protein A2Y38_01870 [Spirochaetes bacterium GWB1_59_5]|nr:MAG: hypothetical protein A2Y38_01870 [Spirochaetes bacterium GWB1_59_5]